MGDLALTRKTQVNIMTIKGEACKMDVIGQLCDRTNGSLTRVTPERLTTDFANILDDEVVGTQVRIRVMLHKALRFRNELPTDISKDGAVMDRHMPIATSKTKLSFEYELRPQAELDKLMIDPRRLKLIPFQAQVEYYNGQGRRLLRLLTDAVPTTGSRE